MHYIYINFFNILYTRIYLKNLNMAIEDYLNYLEVVFKTLAIIFSLIIIITYYTAKNAK